MCILVLCLIDHKLEKYLDSDQYSIKILVRIEIENIENVSREKVFVMISNLK